MKEETLDTTQPQQSKEGLFIEKGFSQGQIFKRKDCLDYDLGYACYTREYYKNCDGIVMKFYDDKEVLSDFCELITKPSDEVTDVVYSTFSKVKETYKITLQNILKEFEKL